MAGMIGLSDPTLEVALFFAVALAVLLRGRSGRLVNLSHFSPACFWFGFYR